MFHDWLIVNKYIDLPVAECRKPLIKGREYAMGDSPVLQKARGCSGVNYPCLLFFLIIQGAYLIIQSVEGHRGGDRCS